MPFVVRGGCHDILTATFSNCIVRLSGGPGAMITNDHCAQCDYTELLSNYVHDC